MTCFPHFSTGVMEGGSKSGENKGGEEESEKWLDKPAT